MSNDSSNAVISIPACDLPRTERKAAAVRVSLTVDQITAERERITQTAKARYEAGDRTGLNGPRGHYMCGDSVGVQVFEWMTDAELDRFHILGLAFPSTATLRDEARARVKARIAARKEGFKLKRLGSTTPQPTPDLFPDSL